LGAVFSIASDGKAGRSFGRKGSAGSMFADPVDVAATNNEIFVLEKSRNTVMVFDTRGNFVRSFGSGGDGKGELKNAESITKIGETVLVVSDTGNKRIQVWQNIYTPEAPEGLVAKAGMRSISLTWQNSKESFVDSYIVRRAATETGPYVNIAETSEPLFVDHNVEPDKKYFYRVAALIKSGNESRQSSMVSGVPSKFRPQPPVGLKGTGDEWAVTVTWKQGKEDFVTGYNIYRKRPGKLEKVGSTGERSFREGGLSSNTPYTYLVAAVSSDGIESERVSVEVSTIIATKPPLGIGLVAMDNIFSNTYKKYESDGVGRISVTNNTGVSIKKIKVSFKIKNFMDFPSEVEINTLLPGESREVLLKAVFNNNILNLTEDTPIQTEVEASYYDDEKLLKFIHSFPANIYEKHRMMWDEREQFATFITPKDPVLLEFVRSVAAQYPEGDFSMQRSAAVFGALGVLGLTYIPDPSNPYQVTFNRTDFVDYVQYPQETLQRKSGDCDDLVALYSSALESLGMRTKVIEVPGHMLMMFSTGIDVGEDVDTMDGLFIVHENQLWVAVETTLVGASFIKAWEKGSETYYAWKDKGLTILDIQEAWKKFKPASLQHGSWRPTFIERKNIDERFNNEFSTLKRTGLRLKSRSYRDRFAADNNDLDAVLQIGIIYGKAGETSDALEAFEKVLEIEPGNVAALNNIGNINLLEKKYEEAALAYEQAVKVEPADALIWVNLARCYVQMGKKDEAQDAFAKALEIDKNIVKKYRVLAIELMSAI
jgi:tetratricopeptide (TPR) repeat protein